MDPVAEPAHRDLLGQEGLGSEVQSQLPQKFLAQFPLNQLLSGQVLDPGQDPGQGLGVLFLAHPFAHGAHPGQAVGDLHRGQVFEVSGQHHRVPEADPPHHRPDDPVDHLLVDLRPDDPLDFRDDGHDVGSVRLRVGKPRVLGDGPQGHPRQEEPDHHLELPGVEDDLGLSQVLGDFLGHPLGQLLVLGPEGDPPGFPDHPPEKGFRGLAVSPENPVQLRVFHGLEVRDLDGDEPAGQGQVQVPGLIGLWGVHRRKHQLQPGGEAQEAPGPDEFVELGLDEGVGPVEFIKQGGVGLPDGQGGGDELEDPLGQALGVQKPHQVVKIQGGDLVVPELAPRLG